MFVLAAACALMRCSLATANVECYMCATLAQTWVVRRAEAVLYYKIDHVSVLSVTVKMTSPKKLSAAIELYDKKGVPCDDAVGGAEALKKVRREFCSENDASSRLSEVTITFF